jgi:hypothetical protein
VTSATRHSGPNASLLHINTFTQEKDHLNVTCVIKHFVTRVPILDIKIYILEKYVLGMTSATVHSDKNPTFP